MTPVTGWIYQASAVAKLYLEGDQLLITVDRADLTDILFLKPGGQKPQSSAVLTPVGSKMSSFVCDSSLFRLRVIKKGLALEAYSLNDTSRKAMIEYILDKNNEEDKVYFRVLRTGLINHEEHLKKAILRARGLGVPALVVHHVQQQYQIVVGSFYNEKGHGLLPGLSPTAFLSFAIVTALKQVKVPPGESRYWYCAYENEKTSFTIAPINIFRKIDDYEIKPMTSGKLVGTLVSNVNNGYLVYFDSKSATLKVVKVTQ